MKLPDTDRFYEKDESEIYSKYHIDCHGGITFTGETLPKSVPEYNMAISATIPVYSRGWYIGWDYAHLEDYIEFPMSIIEDGKKWTTEEMIADCYDVINQLCTANCCE